MSGIYTVLFAQENSGSWITQLENVITGIGRRGGDGTRTATLNGKIEISPPGKLYSRNTKDGELHTDYQALIGCAYSQPISLPGPDAGPFISKPGHFAMAYDGVIAGYTGQQALDWLIAENAARNWVSVIGQLDGQFSLLLLDASQPRRVYYAVKAKPLYVLYDSLGRGTIVSSSKDALRGQYHATRNPQPVELSPYTCGYITLEGAVTRQASLVRWPGEGSLVLSGGGLDTLVAAFDAKRRYPTERMQLVYFDYGTKARDSEVRATERIANAIAKRYYGTPTTWRSFEFPLLAQLAASNLIDDREAISKNPQAGRASEWVPARNTVLMSLALAYAESAGYARIVTGINPDAATAYPDNDEAWSERMQAVVPYALGSDRFVKLEAPLSQLSKVGIVSRGAELKIPWKEAGSWSCYDGGAIHCGLCSSCRARRKAFVIAKVVDPTEYEV